MILGIATRLQQELKVKFNIMDLDRNGILSFVPLDLAYGLSTNSSFMVLILLLKFHLIFSEQHKALHILYMHH